jgi:hypothetical protein
MEQSPSEADGCSASHRLLCNSSKIHQHGRALIIGDKLQKKKGLPVPEISIPFQLVIYPTHSYELDVTPQAVWSGGLIARSG